MQRFWIPKNIHPNPYPISNFPLHPPHPILRQKKHIFLPPAGAIHFQPISLNTISNTSRKDLKMMGKRDTPGISVGDQLPKQNGDQKSQLFNTHSQSFWIGTLNFPGEIKAPYISSETSNARLKSHLQCWSPCKHHHFLNCVPPRLLS